MGDLFVRYESSKRAGADLVKAARSSSLPLAEEAVFWIPADQHQAGIEAARQEFARFAPLGSFLTIYEGRPIGRTSDPILFLPDAVVLVEEKKTPRSSLPDQLHLTLKAQDTIAVPPLQEGGTLADKRPSAHDKPYNLKVTEPIPVRVVNLPDMPTTPASREVQPQVVQHFHAAQPTVQTTKRAKRKRPFHRVAIAAAVIGLVGLGMHIQSTLAQDSLPPAVPLYPAAHPTAVSYVAAVAHQSHPVARVAVNDHVRIGLVENGSHAVELSLSRVPSATYEVKWDSTVRAYAFPTLDFHGTTLTLRDAAPDTSYTLQVRAEFGDGNYGPWSAPFTVRTYPTWISMGQAVWTSVPKVLTGIAIGSSFRIPGPYYVTCYHVVRGSMNDVSLLNLAGDTVPAQVVAYSAADDLAVLKANLPDTVPFPGSRLHPPHVGQPVAVFGYPKGHNLQVAMDLAINGVDQTQQVYTMPMQHNIISAVAYTLPGNSGGPLVNRWGQIVGVDENAPPSAAQFKGVYYYHGKGVDGFESIQTLDTFLRQVFSGTPEWTALVQDGY